MKSIEAKTNGRCAYCGVYVRGAATIDHIIPKSTFDYQVYTGYKVPFFLSHLFVGQKEHQDNLFAACKYCNEYKSDLSIEDFRRLVESSLKRLNKKTQYQIAKRFGMIEEARKINVKFYFEHLEKFRN